MGGDWVVNDGDLNKPGLGTDMISAEERLAHVKECLPEICSLDCGTMNFGNGNEIYISTPPFLREMAALTKKWEVKPELEVFDTGHMWFANQMYDEGLLDSPPLFQICLGIHYGAPANTGSLKNMVDMLPAGSNWAAFGIGVHQMPMVAQAVLLGGNVRVGLEENLYLEKGVYASNGQLIEKATTIISTLGANVMGPDEARKKLGLKV